VTFTHIVTFRWRAAEVDDAAITAALRALTGDLDGVRSYRCGADVGLTPTAYDFAVVGTFEDREAFLAYRDHPEHQRILSEMILPNVEDRTVVQLED
jgi:hypothetical protein